MVGPWLEPAALLEPAPAIGSADNTPVPSGVAADVVVVAEESLEATYLGEKCTALVVDGRIDVQAYARSQTPAPLPATDIDVQLLDAARIVEAQHPNPGLVADASALAVDVTTPRTHRFRLPTAAVVPSSPAPPPHCVLRYRLFGRFRPKLPLFVATHARVDRAGQVQTVKMEP